MAPPTSANQTPVLDRYINFVNALNETIGRWLSWLLVGMTAVMLVIIFSASALNRGWIWMSESVVYMHAILFMFAAAYTFLHDRHVRIDVFYRALSPRRRSWINLIGVLVLLAPTCAVILIYSFPYVASSWAVGETSPEGDGLPTLFLFKTCLLVLPTLLLLQGLAVAARAWQDIRRADI